MSQATGPTATPATPAPVATPPIPLETSLLFLIPTLNGIPILAPLDEQIPKVLTLGGTIQLGCVVAHKGSDPAPAPPGLMVQYRVDDVVVAGPAPWNSQVPWDSRSVPSQAHTISVDPVDALANGELLQPRCLSFIVHNLDTGGAPTWDEPHQVHVCNPGFRQLISSQRPVAVPWPGRLPGLDPMPLPAPVGSVVQAQTASDLRNPQYWTAEAVVGAPGGGLYRPNLQWFRTGAGHVTTLPMYARGPVNAEDAAEPDSRQPWFCGKRPRGTITPYATYVPHPLTGGWVFITVGGRVGVLERDGDTRTIFGPVNKRHWEVVPTPPPYVWTDKTVTPGQRADDHDFVGQLASPPLHAPTDICQWPGDPDRWLIADYEGDRIALLDLRNTPQAFVQKGANPPWLTTFVTGGFHGPQSICVVNGLLYVADTENCAIKTVDLTTKTVTTVAGGSLHGGTPPPRSAVTPQLYPANVPGGNPAQNQSDWMLYPQAIRPTHDGKIVIVENLTAAVKVLDHSDGHVTLLRTRIIDSLSAANNPWTWLEVDSGGLAGPVDDVFVPLVGGQGNAHIERIAIDGTLCGAMLPGKGTRYDGLQEATEPDNGRHYPWAIGIDRTGAIITSGMGSESPIVLRRRTTGDQAPGPNGSWLQGQLIWRLGTHPAFGMNVRPSFQSSHGVFGSNRLGTLTVDQAAKLWTDIAASVGPQQAYWIWREQICYGSLFGVPRPELDGQPLWDLARYILEASCLPVPPLPARPAIGPAPQISGLSLSRTPTGDVVVSWSPATFGVLRYARPGQTSPLGRSWDVGFGNVTIANVPSGPLTWWLTVVDGTGASATVTALA